MDFKKFVVKYLFLILPIPYGPQAVSLRAF